MVDNAKSFAVYGIDRVFGEAVKNGFILLTPDGEHVGEIRDLEHLKELPTKKVSFKRMIDIMDNNGFYLRYIEPKVDGLIKTIFPTTETGCIFDKYWLDEMPFETGDVLRITLIPKNSHRFMIRIEYKWEDQVDER